MRHLTSGVGRERAEGQMMVAKSWLSQTSRHVLQTQLLSVKLMEGDCTAIREQILDNLAIPKVKRKKNKTTNYIKI